MNIFYLHKEFNICFQLVMVNNKREKMFIRNIEKKIINVNVNF
jgi:uncharacterized protein YlaN (UPF0358 family)